MLSPEVMHDYDPWERETNKVDPTITLDSSLEAIWKQ